jgi:UDP-glucose 4-epimerase
MRLLITGGAGFIGSHLADALLAKGHQVVAVDNLRLGREDNIAHLRDHPAFSFRRLDVLDEAALEEVFSTWPLDGVFHLAANSDIAQSYRDPDVDRDNTFATTYAVLKAMKAHAVQQIVFASTSAVYGERSDLLEEDSGPLHPVSHYGAGKLASEAFLSSFAANYGFRVWILRFPNVVGPRSTHGVIHDFIHKLRRQPDCLEVLGDGTQTKPYLHVSDLVQAILTVWGQASERVNVFNVGVESRTTVRRIAAMVIEEMGLPARIHFTGGSRGWVGDVPAFHYRLDRVHKLGWRAGASSDEAVRLAIRQILEAEHASGHPGGGKGDAARAVGHSQTPRSHRGTDAA